MWMFNCARIYPRWIISSDKERYLREEAQSRARNRGGNNKSRRERALPVSTKAEREENGIRRRGPVKLSPEYRDFPAFLRTPALSHVAGLSFFTRERHTRAATLFIARQCAWNVSRWIRRTSVVVHFRGHFASNSDVSIDFAWKMHPAIRPQVGLSQPYGTIQVRWDKAERELRSRGLGKYSTTRSPYDSIQ